MKERTRKYIWDQPIQLKPVFDYTLLNGEFFFNSNYMFRLVNILPISFVFLINIQIIFQDQQLNDIIRASC